MSIRHKHQIEAEQRHADQTADDGAVHAVAAAVFVAVFKVGAHAEDHADAGEGRAAADEVVNDRAQRGRESRFDVAHANRRVDEILCEHRARLLKSGISQNRVYLTPFWWVKQAKKRGFSTKIHAFFIFMAYAGRRRASASRSSGSGLPLADIFLLHLRRNPRHVRGRR